MICTPTGPVNAKILIVGEAPGEEEERLGVPFVGQSGQELDRMLHEAGIARSECFVTNVVRHRPPQNRIELWVPEKKKDILPGFIPCQGKIVHPNVVAGLDLLRKEIKHVNPNVIVAVGNTALWALTGLTGITSWRGSLLEFQEGDSRAIKLIPALHPASVLRVWSQRNITVHDLRRVRKESQSPDIRHLHYDILVKPDLWEARLYLEGLLRRLDSSQSYVPLSVDIETRGRRFISCVGIADSSVSAISIPIMSTERPEGYWGLDDEVGLIRLMIQVFTHPRAFIIGQNFSYDQQYFAKEWGVIIPCHHDTLTAQQVLYPGTPKDLSYLSSLYCEDHVHWKEEGKEWNMESGEENWNYNGKDAARTFEIADGQAVSIERAGLTEVFSFQMRLQYHTLRMMLRGLRYDSASMPALRLELHNLQQHRLTRIEKVLGHPINPGSPLQLQTLFYTDFKLPIVKHPKTKKPTTDDGAMEKFKEREPLLIPICNWILDYRSFGTFRSTFADAQLGTDGRMHSSFNINGPYTFRMSSSTDAFDAGQNLQNIPTEESKSFAKALKRGSADDLPDMRKYYFPDVAEDMIFWNADLDRADLQVVVWEANDFDLMQMLREGVDLHIENAKVLFGLKMHQVVTKAMRGFAKAFVHGTNYGGSAKTMAIASGVTTREAELAQNRWFAAHPGIKQWHNRVLEQIQTTRKITNKFGYRWVIFDRLETAFTEALAWVPQSTVSCVINRGLVNIGENLPRVKAGRLQRNPEVLIQVHDSLAGNMPKDFDTELIRKELTITIPYDTPLIIPVSIKTSPVSWGDCK